MSDDQTIIPVILSGGSGTRLWPLSRKAYPKQLHALFGDQTMLQATIDRVSHLAAPIIVCNEDQRFMVAEQAQLVLKERYKDAQIVLEPIARNTAAAIAAAAEVSKLRSPDSILVVLAADHVIHELEAFRRSLDTAIETARQNKIAIFGVKPTRAETGYGYIEVGVKLDTNTFDNASGKQELPFVSPDGCEVKAFREKPKEELAREYLASGAHFWNSGMFVLSSDKVETQLDLYDLNIVRYTKSAVDNGMRDLDFFRLSADSFGKIPSVSFDVAVLERTSDAWMVPLQSDWSDVGSWDAVHERAEKDSKGNVQRGDCYLQDTESSLVFSSGNRLVSVSGLRDVVVVDTDDALMVSTKKAAQNVKSIVSWIEHTERHEYLHHRKQYRPWGSFDELSAKQNYRIREVHIKPGQAISSQTHRSRSEHWVVVSGSALVEREGIAEQVCANESIYIKAGQQHKVSNPGAVQLVLVEVSSGSSISEDDIQRDGG